MVQTTPWAPLPPTSAPCLAAGRGGGGTLPPARKGRAHVGPGFQEINCRAPVGMGMRASPVTALGGVDGQFRETMAEGAGALSTLS